MTGNEVTMGHFHDKKAEKKRIDGLALKSPMKVFGAFKDLGNKVFADGALSKKQKELTALAVAISQNCFD
ncbi:MAG: carboxymuconolactone decarboxylase family protein [candidate division NC10 bacterium]